MSKNHNKQQDGANGNPDDELKWDQIMQVAWQCLLSIACELTRRLKLGGI
jgi:hypothetical protein